MMVDPAVTSHNYKPFQTGVETDTFMKEQNGPPYTGVVLVLQASPTGSRQHVRNEKFDTFFDKDTSVDIDGLGVDMNEPSKLLQPPPAQIPCSPPSSLVILLGPVPFACTLFTLCQASQRSFSLTATLPSNSTCSVVQKPVRISSFGTKVGHRRCTLPTASVYDPKVEVALAIMLALTTTHWINS